MPPDAHANAPRDNARPQPANQVATSRVALHPLRGATPLAGRYTRYGALNPLRGAAPVAGRYTRTDRVQCLRIGCNAHGSGAMPTDRVQCLRIGCTALADKNDRGTWNPTTRKKEVSTPLHQTRDLISQLSGDITRGAAPVTGRCTRTERVQCPRIGCNAHGSGAMPADRVYRAPRQERPRNLESHNAKERGLNAPTPNPRLDKPINRRHHAGRCTRCGVLHPLRGAAPEQNGCNAYGSGVPCSQIRTTAEPGIPQHEGKRPQHPNTQTRTGPQAAASRVVLRPLRGATPVPWRCTRTERVQCPRIGCNAHRSGAMPTDRVQCPRIGCTALPDKNDRGTWNPTTRKTAASTPLRKTRDLATRRV